MSSSFAASRAQLVFALCLPIAVLLGYLLAEPDFGNVLLIGLMIGILSIPILMYWYHPLLVLTWNAAITPFFLPGQPFLWMIFAFLGFGFAVVNRLTSPEKKILWVPSVNRPLLILLVVVVATGWLRGGFGVRVFGSGQYGGRGYFYVLAAVLGYFALVSQRIQKHRGPLFVTLFFMAGLTALIPNLAYLGGSKFEFLFYIFPPVYAFEQAMGDYDVTLQFSRLYGLTYASMALYCWLFARHGLRGCFDLTRPWRLGLLLAAALGCLYCGFRSFMALFVIALAVQFFLEGLHKARAMLMVGIVGLIVSIVAIPNLDKLPFVVQRSLSFLPLPLSPAVKANAEASSEWRLNMWRDVLPEVSKYLLAGKGYNMNPGDLDLAIQSGQRGIGANYAWALVTGAYHNGPLTLLVPFGLWGLGVFIWFAVGSLKYLTAVYRRGDPDLKPMNRFMLAFFIAHLIHYTFVFGNFSSDLFFFTGIIGLSVSINGALIEAEVPAKEETEAAHSEEFAALAER